MGWTRAFKTFSQILSSSLALCGIWKCFLCNLILGLVPPLLSTQILLLRSGGSLQPMNTHGWPGLGIFLLPTMGPLVLCLGSTPGLHRPWSTAVTLCFALVLYPGLIPSICFFQDWAEVLAHLIKKYLQKQYLYMIKKWYKWVKIILPSTLLPSPPPPFPRGSVFLIPPEALRAHRITHGNPSPLHLAFCIKQ